jgi:diadenosine tetraphosphatase ApaH/serine/threonine PP2A family protein phosphatase
MIKYNGLEFSRAIIISDIHGLYSEFSDLISLCDIDAKVLNSDLVISVGDLEDRGPRSADVIKLCRKRNYQVVKGNHCDNWLGHHRNELREKSESGYKNKKRPLREHDYKEFKKLDNQDWEWMSNLPKYIEFESLNQQYIVVHAGFLPGIPYNQQSHNIISRVRYIDINTRQMIPYKVDNDPPPNSKYWTDFWQGPQKVIYGHQIWNQNHVRLSNNNLCYGIDTGLYKAGRLTALIIDASNPYIDRLSYKQIQGTINYDH